MPGETYDGTPMAAAGTVIYDAGQDTLQHVDELLFAGVIAVVHGVHSDVAHVQEIIALDQVPGRPIHD